MMALDPDLRSGGRGRRARRTVRHPVRGLLLAAALAPLPVAAVAACGGPGDAGSRPGEGETAPAALASRPESPLPDPDGWGAHVLALGVAPDGAVWVGTYGQGIFVSRSGTGDDWERIVASREDSASISWDFVNAFAFAGDEIWYGTVGNGWGVSRDGGRSWDNWTFRKLGPRWQYVVPNGIAVAGDTVFVATADGLRITADDGENWREVTEHNGLPDKYLLALGVEPRGGEGTRVRVAHLRGVSESLDGGRTWTTAREMGGEATRAWLASARPAERDGPALGTGIPEATCAGSELTRRICEWTRAFRSYPDPGDDAIPPSDRAHFWFRRAVLAEDNPHLDQTYTYG
ncbi:MAG: hypothetical protein R6X22_05570, partial [Gemmatimonadota bacterium]